MCICVSYFTLKSQDDIKVEAKVLKKVRKIMREEKGGEGRGVRGGDGMRRDGRREGGEGGEGGEKVR